MNIKQGTLGSASFRNESRVETVAAGMKQNVLFTEAAVKRMAAEKEMRLVSECSAEGFSAMKKFYTPGL